MTWMEFVRIAALWLVTLVLGAFTLSFVWFTLKDQQAKPQGLGRFEGELTDFDIQQQAKKLHAKAAKGKK